MAPSSGVCLRPGPWSPVPDRAGGAAPAPRRPPLVLPLRGAASNTDPREAAATSGGRGALRAGSGTASWGRPARARGPRTRHRAANPAPPARSAGGPRSPGRASHLPAGSPPSPAPRAPRPAPALPVRVATRHAHSPAGTSSPGGDLEPRRGHASVLTSHSAGPKKGRRGPAQSPPEPPPFPSNAAPAPGREGAGPGVTWAAAGARSLPRVRTCVRARARRSGGRPPCRARPPTSTSPGARAPGTLSGSYSAAGGGWRRGQRGRWRHGGSAARGAGAGAAGRRGRLRGG